MPEDRSPQAYIARSYRKLRRRTSVATRLAGAALTITILSLVAAMLIATTGAGNSAEALLRDRLGTLRSAKGEELEAHFQQNQAQLASLAASRMTVDALRDFDEAYRDLDASSLDDLSEETSSIAEFYLDEFIPSLETVRGAKVDLLGLSSGATPAGVYLQAKYIADNPLEMSERGLLTDAGDGSSWTEVHKQFHPSLRAAADRLGFADLYLIEPATDTVVYSTNKDIAFATSLDGGPHSGTSLARLVDRVIADGQPGAVSIADYAVYPPTLDNPTVFMATPLVDDGATVGVLAVALSRDPIDRIMTRDVRFGLLGETGEVFLVGEDQKMRSDSRLFLEDPDAYSLRAAEQAIVTPAEQQRIDTLGTTVLFQDAKVAPARSALMSETGQTESTSYLGEEVVTAYQPLQVTDLNWALLTEQQIDEVDAPVADYRRESIVITVIFVVALTFLLVAWANSFVNPIRAISASLLWIREKGVALQVPTSGTRELRALSKSLNRMVADLSRRKEQVSGALTRKLTLLRTMLPPAAAERVGIGDRHLLETVPQATVVVLVVHGLDELVRSRSVDENQRSLQSFIDAADRRAAINGLERVKVMGDSYYAVCGLGTPYLDHAPRGVTFARQAQTMLLRLAEDEGVDVDLSAGINSGPVTAGLVGDSRLVYDLWGDTVDTAHTLARRAGRGQIVVSDTTRDRLPAGATLERVTGSDPGPSAWLYREPAREVSS